MASTRALCMGVTSLQAEKEFLTDLATLSWMSNTPPSPAQAWLKLSMMSTAKPWTEAALMASMYFSGVNGGLIWATS